MSDPARDGYQCHGVMIPILSGEDGPSGYVCTTCGVTRNMVRRHNPMLRAEVDRVLYEVATIVSGQQFCGASE